MYRFSGQSQISQQIKFSFLSNIVCFLKPSNFRFILQEPVDPVPNLLTSQFGKNFESVVEAPRADEQTSKLHLQSKQQWLGLLLEERFHSQGWDRWDVCRELECSKSGERWVILGFLFRWE